MLCGSFRQIPVPGAAPEFPVLRAGLDEGADGLLVVHRGAEGADDLGMSSLFHSFSLRLYECKQVSAGLIPSLFYTENVFLGRVKLKIF